MSDTHQRSVAKALSWRAIATLTTTVLVFVFTGSISLSLGVGIFDLVLKLLFYYVHERGWNAISWGRG